MAHVSARAAIVANISGGCLTQTRTCRNSYTNLVKELSLLDTYIYIYGYLYIHLLFECAAFKNSNGRETYILSYTGVTLSLQRQTTLAKNCEWPRAAVADDPSSLKANMRFF